jgi:S1-C subfamily serine protease
MTHAPGIQKLSDKLLSGRGVKTRIALASGLILAVGAWLTPQVAQTPLSAPQERAAPLFEEQVQLREATRTFVGVQDVAGRVSAHTVAIPGAALRVPAGRNDFSEPRSATAAIAGFGVFVSDTFVLTHSVALDGRSSVQLSAGGDRTVEGRVVAYEPSTGLVLLQTAPSGTPPVVLASDAPAAGALAVGVGRSDLREVAMPIFITGVGGDHYTIGGINESILPGMPVYNLAGELFAIAAPDGREIRALPVREAAPRLLARASAGERHASFGLGFQALTGALTRTFGERGVVVTEVIPGGPADLADIQPGDVLLTVGDVEIDSVDTAARALGVTTVGTPTPVQVMTGRRVRDIEVTPALAYEVAALARTSTVSESGLEARVVIPVPLLEAAAIPPAARLLTVNGRAVISRAQVRRDLRLARNPVPVLLRYDDEQFFAVIEPIR